MDFGLNELLFFGSTAFKAIGEHETGEYKEKIQEFNAKIANEQVEVAMRRGQDQERQLRENYSLLLGKQRAAMGAQGLDLEEDTALNIQLDTVRAKEIDINTLRNNVALEAWGYQVQAWNYSENGKMLAREYDMEAIGTIADAASRYGMAAGYYGKKSNDYPYSADAAFSGARPTISSRSK